MPAALEDWPDGLEVWNDPAATLCVTWLDSAISYLMHFERLKHLFLSAENAGASAIALEPLLEKLSKTTSSAINPAAEAYEKFRDHVRARVNADPECRVQCKDVLARLEKWGTEVFPHMTTGEKTVHLGPNEYLTWWQAIIRATPDTIEIAAEILEHLLPKH